MPKVYPRGRSPEIVLAAGDSIAIFTKGDADVLQKSSFANYPSSEAIISSLSNEHKILGPYASGATLIIDNGGADEALYEVGTDPVVKEYYNRESVLTDPVALNASGAITVDALLGGIITSTTAAAVAADLPTGAVLDAASEFASNKGVEWTAINTGPNTFTVTAAAGHTVIGAGAVATGTSGTFVTRKTAADTFITYRK